MPGVGCQVSGVRANRTLSIQNSELLSSHPAQRVDDLAEEVVVVLHHHAVGLHGLGCVDHVVHDKHGINRAGLDETLMHAARRGQATAERGVDEPEPTQGCAGPPSLSRGTGRVAAPTRSRLTRLVAAAAQPVS